MIYSMPCASAKAVFFHKKMAHASKKAIDFVEKFYDHAKRLSTYFSIEKAISDSTDSPTPMK
jgi:hypothetical protein